MIHIACQTDERLIPACAAMLHSLFAANPGEAIDVHFLCDDSAPPATWAALARVVKAGGGRWSPEPIAMTRLAGLPRVDFYGGYAAVYRLFLPSLLPDLPRVLYIDADTLVIDRIRPLWERDMEGCAVGAVTNPLYRIHAHRVTADLGLPDHLAYFNSGVLLLDLDALRATGLDHRLLEFARDMRERLCWPDQDVLNAVLWPSRLQLHPRWNAMPFLWSLPNRDLPWDRKEVDEARQAPAIAHFLGPYKPGHYRCAHPYRDRYWQHLAAAGFDRPPLVGRTARHRVIKRLPPLAQWSLETKTPELRLEAIHWARDSTLGALVADLLGRQRPPLDLVLRALTNALARPKFVQIGYGEGDGADVLRPLALSGRWRGTIVARGPDEYEGLRQRFGHHPQVTLRTDLPSAAELVGADLVYVHGADAASVPGGPLLVIGAAAPPGYSVIETGGLSLALRADAAARRWTRVGRAWRRSGGRAQVAPPAKQHVPVPSVGTINGMRSFWDDAARKNATWFVDTSLHYVDPDMEQFFATGRDVVRKALIDAPVKPATFGTAVEIGSGIGRICVALAEHFDRVIGIDISKEMVSQARELITDPRVEFIVGDGQGLAGIDDRSTDFLTSFTVLQHIPSTAMITNYLIEAGRVLRPGGVFAFQWNNSPGARWWPAERWIRSTMQRAGLGRSPHRTEAPQFLGSKVPLEVVRFGLQTGGLDLIGTRDLGTLFAWGWAIKAR